MKKLIIYPYKIGSDSAKTLAEKFNTRRVHPDGAYIPKRRHVILNWGNSTVPNWLSVVARRGAIFLNKPEAVALAANKLKTFQTLDAADVATVPFTNSIEEARDWVEDDKVVCRTLLTSHSGNGIVLAKTPEEIVEAPLYTMYVKKVEEYRVHVFQGNVIDFVAKKHKAGEEPTNKYIRSTNNGWVFCRDGITLSDGVRSTAIAAVRALGLDFGAVDIIVGKEDGVPYVLEINTAAGMEGTTVDKYVEAIKPLLASRT